MDYDPEQNYRIQSILLTGWQDSRIKGHSEFITPVSLLDSLGITSKVHNVFSTLICKKGGGG